MDSARLVEEAAFEESLGGGLELSASPEEAKEDPPSMRESLAKGKGSAASAPKKKPPGSANRRIGAQDSKEKKVGAAEEKLAPLLEEAKEALEELEAGASAAEEEIGERIEQTKRDQQVLKKQ